MVKKCLFQCFSTVVGGTLGVAVMAVVGQSPMLAGLSVAAIVFMASSLSYHTRDANLTFMCAIFAVTVCIMVMVPVTLGPTSDEIYQIFVDRIGTIIVGIVWASFVSACLWPVFSSDLLRLSSGRLFKALCALSCGFPAGPQELHKRLAAVYGSIIEHADLADHCDFEGAWGRRGAQIAREMNKVAIEVSTQAYVLQQLDPLQHQQLACELDELDLLIKGVSAQTIPADADLVRLESFAEDVRERAARFAHEDGKLNMLLLKLADLALQFKTFAQLYRSLMRAERVSVKGVSVRRHQQLANCFITGGRSATLFLLAYTFWYATGWTFGFLGCIVPVVFSIMLGKLPHPEMILKNIVIGYFFAIPFGLVVNSLLAEAPSAFEILFIVGAPCLFFGLMGLSSLMSFAYSLGFNISFMVFLLPQNVHEINIGFDIERTLCVGLATALLAFLYVWIPRKRVLRDLTGVSKVFEPDLHRFLTDSSVQRTSSTALADSVGLVIDKMVYVSIYEAPEKKPELIEQASRVIFLMSQVRRVSAFVEASNQAPSAEKVLGDWRGELLANYRDGTDRDDHCLASEVASASRGQDSIDVAGQGYLQAMDQLTRGVFIPSS